MASSESIPDASETRAPLLIGVVVLLLSIATLMVGLRVLCRTLIKRFELDDMAAVMTLVMTRYGLGRHEWMLSDENLLLYRRAFWVSILFYMMTLFWAKITFLLHYHRLMPASRMRYVYLGSIAFLSLWGVSQIILAFIQCIPLKALWDPSIKGKCLQNTLSLWYFNGVFNIVTDFAIIILPLPIYWKIQLPRAQKVYVMCIFGLGFFTVAVSILRMQWLKPASDQTWWNATAASWSLAELTSAITCACLPTFKPLITRVKPFFTRSSKGDSTVQLQMRNPETDEESSLAVMGSLEQLSQDHKKPSRVCFYGTQTSCGTQTRSLC
ncbi:hypothetical protein EDB81DRAFT_670997 [Dactylonectria macrodidyma]|uniref:Rhodopsin domain-containing protein n=1 Tax=Dactylonectria macrodidyma TaxID=307937 RepID=A0A9P9D4Q2_9HYPO|nr:hypothetical protein EDB81DRAFT_670997 [Dactylonectria macrodidyma]